MADDTSQNSGTQPTTGTPPATQTKSGSVDPAKIAEVEAKYTIPESVKNKYPDLIELVLQTESMKQDERDYWFQILPVMSEEQLAKFYGILANEKKQLQKLDAEYTDQMKKLNDKHEREWTDFEVRKKREALQKVESASEKTEAQTEEELLKKLSEA